MYTYLYNMILSHISLQNYFENFPKFKNFPIKKKSVSGLSVDRSIPGLAGRPGRSTEPWDQGVHVLCTSVGRPTGSSLLSVFGRSTGSVNRQFKGKIFFGCRSTDRSTESNGYFANWTVGRPGRSTDSRLQPPMASFLRFCFGICWRFWCQLILKFW